MKKKRVLLVEDDRNVALVIKDSLADSDAASEVEIVASGEEALQRMAQRAWDLVLTDHCMPGMTGLKLIETLKTISPTTRTILITAYGTDELEQAAERLNVYHYMTKPFPLGDLKRVVQSALAS
jgi:two-component system response regulator (stage 0 sporulation protein F)